VKAPNSVVANSPRKMPAAAAPITLRSPWSREIRRL
jgi:hypothetical protein